MKTQTKTKKKYIKLATKIGVALIIIWLALGLKEAITIKEFYIG